MTFAEYAMLCGGFEDFHAAKPEDTPELTEADAERHYRALGIVR